MDGCDCATVQKMINDLQARLVQVEGRAPRSKRAPSKYNLFMKDCIKSLKGTKPIQELFRECASRYKAQKK